jgi:AcrR family transcriptional regulator
MATAALFDDVDDDTRAAILRATFRALCEHGYANLTIDRIGAEFEKSTSLLYHHYDGKDDLLLEFLDYMLSRLEADPPGQGAAEGSPNETLVDLLDHLLDPDPDETRRSFMRAMVELRAQAAHDPEYRVHFTESDRVFRERFRSLIEAGIAAGQYESVDPDRVARTLVTVVNGSFVESVTTEDGSRADTRAAVAEYLDRTLGRTSSQ